MSVAKMKDGKRWYVSVRYTDWTGEVKQHKKEGFTRKADAKEYERTYLTERTGSSHMTVHTLYKIYIEDCRSKLRPTTIANKEFLFEKHILPYLGKLVASEVTPNTIRTWQNALLKATTDQGNPYSKTFLKTIHNQLSAMFNFGIRYYGLKLNPCQQAGAIKNTSSKEMQFWTVDEFNKFIDAVSDNPKTVVMFSLLFWTGMRSGEMWALTPADFNFADNTINISKNYARHNNEDLIMEPKTSKGKRTITMPEPLAVMMQKYIAGLYDIQPTDRIFAGSTRNHMRYAMTKGCKVAGVKEIRIHDLRHSHASLLIELGYSPLLIAERLGHENIETTLQIYSHLYPNKQSALAADLSKYQKCYDFVTLKFL